MSDYGTMQARIADELARTDLTTQIRRAIQTAIKHHERKKLKFNQATGTFSTVASQEYYSSSDLADIPNLVLIDAVKITIGGTSYPLVERDFSEIDALNNGTTTGDPEFYAYYKQQIRLSPVPSAANTVTLAYVKKLAALSADGDTNAWMVDGEELIRLTAKLDLFINVIRTVDQLELDRLKQREIEVLDAMETEAKTNKTTTLRTEIGGRYRWSVIRGQ